MFANTLKTRGLHVTLRFAPPALLDRDRRRQFQMKTSVGFDWARHEYTDRVWRLASPQAEGDPRSHLKLTVEPDQMHFEDLFPVSPFDVYSDNLRLLLEAVAEVFGTKVLLGSRAIVRLTAEAPGHDARVFLGNKCLGLDSRLGPLGRPVHAVGLKMLMPAIALQDQPPWQVEVKVESLVEDVRQLFIEADAQWAAPMPWGLDEVIRRLRVAHDFTNKEVVAFLAAFDVPTGGA
jgi:hypothetical protein